MKTGALVCFLAVCGCGTGPTSHEMARLEARITALEAATATEGNTPAPERVAGRILRCRTLIVGDPAGDHVLMVDGRDGVISTRSKSTGHEVLIRAHTLGCGIELRRKNGSGIAFAISDAGEAFHVIDQSQTERIMAGHVSTAEHNTAVIVLNDQNGVTRAAFSDNENPTPPGAYR